jgi:hypothetical protein
MVATSSTFYYVVTFLTQLGKSDSNAGFRSEWDTLYLAYDYVLLYVDSAKFRAYTCILGHFGK